MSTWFEIAAVILGIVLILAVVSLGVCLGGLVSTVERVARALEENRHRPRHGPRPVETLHADALGGEHL